MCVCHTARLCYLLFKDVLLSPGERAQQLKVHTAPPEFSFPCQVAQTTYDSAPKDPCLQPLHSCIQTQEIS